MKRIWLAVAAAVGLAATGRADFGGPVPSAPPRSPYAGGHDGGNPAAEREKYGLLPAIRQIVWKTPADKGCATCGPTAGGYGAPAYGPMPGYGGGMPGYGGGGGMPGYGYGGGTPGTLVFPNHPYSRGPRDFFMYQPVR